MTILDLKKFVAKFKGNGYGHINDGTKLIFRLEDGSCREVREIQLTNDGYMNWAEVLLERRNPPIISKNGMVSDGTRTRS